MATERSAFHSGPEGSPSNQGRIHSRRPNLPSSFFTCNKAADHTFRIADVYVSQLSRGRTLFLTRYGGARKNRSTRIRGPQLCLTADGPCLGRTGHLFAVSGLCRPSQKIECVFTASPETIRRKSPEIDSPLLSRLRAGPGSLRAVESCVCLVVAVVLGGSAAFVFSRHKRALPAIDRQEIGHHLAGDR
jgi:hypothetical protein